MKFNPGDLIAYRGDAYNRVFELTKISDKKINGYHLVDIITRSSSDKSVIGTIYTSNYCDDTWFLVKPKEPKGHPLTKIFK